ncbi:hypothetical protein PAXRUDRAFT_473287 [Paxillus rubicundulus Ve08.2h10]|uniref:Unplaced genomic scaffold scaffold_3080, whole genome shotgun sequence n=1 Tax=Paxillus rubicundulus Ve08.2h10 TaxID=930991 RepID=A0A0D0CKI2_9AGAM|nr:hypothetical protein PAXRUDRAFT_473287 [Paxillus rubicundulus Ve08.2h10]
MASVALLLATGGFLGHDGCVVDLYVPTAVVVLAARRDCSAYAASHFVCSFLARFSRCSSFIVTPSGCCLTPLCSHICTSGLHWVLGIVVGLAHTAFAHLRAALHTRICVVLLDCVRAICVCVLMAFVSGPSPRLCSRYLVHSCIHLPGPH